MFFKNKKKIIAIEGMSCKKCTKRIKETLDSINNVKYVKVNLYKKHAIIYYQDNINDDEIINTITNLGYNVIGIKTIN